MFRFAWQPALNVKIIGFKDEFSIMQVVDVFDDLSAVDLPDGRDFIAFKKTHFHSVDVNSFNISNASCLPPTPFSPPGPTHEGQPSAQAHSLTSSSARAINSSCISNSFWLKPIPAGTWSYKTTVG
jgi:hypothetical protein